MNRIILIESVFLLLSLEDNLFDNKNDNYMLIISSQSNINERIEHLKHKVNQ